MAYLSGCIFEALFGYQNILFWKKSPIKWRQCHDMTTAVDWDVEDQFKQMSNNANGLGNLLGAFYSATLLLNNAVIFESCRSLGFPTRFDTNWPVQSQMKARSLKFWL